MIVLMVVCPYCERQMVFHKEYNGFSCDNKECISVEITSIDEVIDEWVEEQIIRKGGSYDKQ